MPKKIQYYNPNIGTRTILSLFLESLPESKLVDYFRSITGKKFILLTNSCRTALYLAYKVSNIPGAVITTPLTCISSVQPIIESGRKVIFADIEENSLNLSATQVEQLLSSEASIVQLVHHGGVPCEISDFIDLKNKYSFLMVEDCAQALGSKYDGRSVGYFGDVSCFSLIKNSYGVSGGVLATDDEGLYIRAKCLQDTFSKQNPLLTVLRIFRGILESYRGLNFFSEAILKIMKKSNFTGHQSANEFIKSLKRPDILSLIVASAQLTMLPKLHKLRISNGKKLAALFASLEGLKTPQGKKGLSSFGKFFVTGDLLDSKVHIKDLMEKGIEARHLANKTGQYYQSKLTGVYSVGMTGVNLPIYEKIHDQIVSLPLTENMTESELSFIFETFKRTISQ